MDRFQNDAEVQVAVLGITAAGADASPPLSSPLLARTRPIRREGVATDASLSWSRSLFVTNLQNNPPPSFCTHAHMQPHPWLLVCPCACGSVRAWCGLCRHWHHTDGCEYVHFLRAVLDARSAGPGGGQGASPWTGDVTCCCFLKQRLPRRPLNVLLGSEQRLP